jgi:hypothetical protein
MSENELQAQDHDLTPEPVKVTQLPFYQEHAGIIILALMAIIIVGVVVNIHKSSSQKIGNHFDTCIVAYNQNGAWIFNKAIAWTHMGYKLLSDSTPGTKYQAITQFALRLPTSKTDSVTDSTSHKLLRIKDSYPVAFLPDSLSHYIHILDTLRIK